MEESHKFFKTLKSTKYTHLSYEDFTQDTEQKIKQLFDFLNVEYSNIIIDRLSKNIKRKSPKILNTETEILKNIGGEILRKTINNTYSPN